ncbi:POZ domain-containing protein [Colletotrichum zoysiae]|uniref:POZ domain-containing protein n=1 Tax=Colletotrichum zoysiae TaxID=1216348 RepID=A0AAD9M609_9PEZI|nr:POZ domain-containing protein [Colletotrichum zoysiae]
MACIPEWVREGGKFSDFTIVCKGTEIPVHRVVLYGQSGFFKALLDSNMKEAREGVVAFDDVDADVMCHLVDFFYSDKKDFEFEPSDLETGVRVWILADRLQTGQAVRTVESRLLRYLNDREQRKAAVDRGVLETAFSHPACAKSVIGQVLAEALWLVIAKNGHERADVELIAQHPELLEKFLSVSHDLVRKVPVHDIFKHIKPTDFVLRPTWSRLLSEAWSALAHFCVAVYAYCGRVDTNTTREAQGISQYRKPRAPKPTQLQVRWQGYPASGVVYKPEAAIRDAVLAR